MLPFQVQRWLPCQQLCCAGGSGKSSDVLPATLVLVNGASARYETCCKLGTP